MMYFKWLRRFVRRNTSPIEETTALKWKRRLSFAYMIVGWNALGIVAYAWYDGKLDWVDYYGLKSEEEKAMPNNEYYARNIGQGANRKLITLKGFTVVKTQDFDVNENKALPSQSSKGVLETVVEDISEIKERQ